MLSTPPAFVLSQDQTLQKNWSPTPPRRAAPGNLISDRETINTDCPSIQRNPTRQNLVGVQKLALNIVHAVEFSRNGRTRVTASRPALRATYLSYHPRCGLRNTKFRPAAEWAWRRRRERRSSSGAVYHLRLEITESQCDFEAIWLRLSRPSRPGCFRFPHRRGDM